MENFIDQIEISNFKSIRHLELTGFKRINLLLGRPNVGKSNLLEALSLFSLPYLWEGSKKLTDLVRLTNVREIFYNGNLDQELSIWIKYKNFKGIRCRTRFEVKTGNLSGFINSSYHQLIAINRKMTPDWIINSKLRLTKSSNPKHLNVVKSYKFETLIRLKEDTINFLLPPFGSNLLYVLELMPELRKLYAQWFRQYGLRLVIDTASHSVKIQKEKGDDEVFQLPYSSVADTLQRIIFYKTAVASNENSVLLFEEPEAHAYPPYVAEFTQEVIRSVTNQFFIVTHSPLIVEQFLSGALDDLGIFMVDFEDGQTVVKGLSTEEIKEVYRYGIDLFFNGESYTV